MELRRGQVAVVTGGASGIGLATAKALAVRGLSIAIADVEERALEEAATSLAGGSAVTAYQVDVGNPEEMDSLARKVLDRFGRVDLLANVAGVFGPRAPTWRQTRQDWEWTLYVNLWGIIHSIGAFVPAMVEAGSGHIVNVASIAGVAPVTGGGNAPYVASKYAVVGISETLREELRHAAPGLGVTVVCPGRVATRIRDSERNRPAAFRAGTATEPPADDLAPFEPAGSDITAERAAERIIEAVETGQFFLLPNPGTRAAVESRFDGLLKDLIDE